MTSTTTATMKKGFFSDGLEILASVCCFVLDQELYGDKEPNHVLDLVESLKSTDPLLKFPTKKRDSPGRPHYPRQQKHHQEAMIMISDHHIHHSLNDHPPDLSVDPFPKKRRLSDIDYHLEDDYQKKRQSNKLYSGSTGAKRRRLVGDQEDHGQNEEKKKTSTTTKRRSAKNKVSGKKQKVIMAGPNPAPEMSDALREKIVKEVGEYSDLKLLIQKSLFKSDLEKDQNRLSMPLGQIAGDDFLTDEEKRKLESRKADDNNHLEGIEIDFFEPNLEFKKSKMTLKKWDYGSSSSYMLSEHWYNVVTRNGLEKKDVVQIWFFRRRDGNNPCIALVNLSQQNVSSSSSTVVDYQSGDSDQPRSDVTA